MWHQLTKLHNIYTLFFLQNFLIHTSFVFYRVGRTARAGRSGLAISLITPYDLMALSAIEEKINIKLTEYKIDGKFIKSISSSFRFGILQITVRLQCLPRNFEYVAWQTELEPGEAHCRGRWLVPWIVQVSQVSGMSVVAGVRVA